MVCLRSPASACISPVLCVWAPSLISAVALCCVSSPRCNNCRKTVVSWPCTMQHTPDRPACAAVGMVQNKAARNQQKLRRVISAGEPALLVSPTGGRLLLFDSRIPHEVLPAHRHRYSITCWFYKQQSSKHLPVQEGAAALAVGTVHCPSQTTSSSVMSSATCLNPAARWCSW